MHDTQLPKSHENVMVVDDTPENLRILVDMLTEEGYAARPTTEPEMAIEAALASPPDLILLDIRMPGMSGFDVCRKLKENETTADIPIIFVSALQALHDRVMGFEAGAVDYISKPIQREEVLARVKTHLELAAQRKLLEAQQEQLKAANAELQAFSYSVSHDLRSPLQAINAYGEILAEDYGELLPADGKDCLQRLGKATVEMKDLIEALLRLSRSTRGNMRIETISLSSIATDHLNNLRKTEPDRNVETHVAPNLTARADAGLMLSVLENLLNNAWKFTRNCDEGRIEVGAERVGSEETFFVRDNGVGFDMANAGKLFAPFQRLHGKSEFAGSGIGLATVQRIIGRHGGKIWAEGSPGHGATFFFQLGGVIP